MPPSPFMPPQFYQGWYVRFGSKAVIRQRAESRTHDQAAAATTAASRCFAEPILRPIVHFHTNTLLHGGVIAVFLGAANGAS
jgi:hypothetical protein